jgi:hypothetical protein
MRPWDCKLQGLYAIIEHASNRGDRLALLQPSQFPVLRVLGISRGRADSAIDRYYLTRSTSEA